MLAQRCNGSPDARITPADRGFCYGDGLFETLALIRGRPLLWQAHLERLRWGCERLGLMMPEVGLLERELAALLEGQALSEPLIARLQLTRGSGGRGYRPAAQAPSNLVLSLHPWPRLSTPLWRQGVCTRLCDTRLAQQPRLAGLKHCNRLEQVLARAEWDDPDIEEGLMCDSQDHLIEATQANLFVRLGLDWLTPELSQAGVRGVMRDQVLMEAPGLRVDIQEGALPLARLDEVEEAFLTNAIIGVWPIRELVGRPLAIGAQTRAIQDRILPMFEGAYA